MRKWCRTNILWNVKNKKRGTNLKNKTKETGRKQRFRFFLSCCSRACLRRSFLRLGRLFPQFIRGQFRGNGSGIRYGCCWRRFRRWLLWEGFSADISAASGLCRIFCGLQGISWNRSFEKQVRKTCIQIQRRVEEMFQQAGSNMVYYCSGQSLYGAVW